MTGPSGNRLYICPSAAPWSIETLGEAILNLLGQIDLPITLESSHCVYYYTMTFMQGQGLAKSRSHVHV